MNSAVICEEIVKIGRRLWDRNMLASADGNISYRLNENEVLITPSGVSKAFMESKDMARIHINGEVLAGNPSSERLMHLEVYRSCPEARAVVHAHPPHAIAWTVAEPNLKRLPEECLSEVILACGSIPFVPYATPSTEEMGNHLKPFLPDHRLMILSRHGGLSWGESLEEAVGGMERLEHSAEILWLAKTMGELTYLEPDQVEKLKSMRQQIGPKTL